MIERMKELRSQAEMIRARVSNPDAALRRHRTGQAHAERGEWDLAVKAFREALYDDPSCEPARRDLDIALTRQAERDGRIAPPPRGVRR